VNEVLAPDSWLIARFAPVSMFSLRSTYATSKGGKTLLVPTPYAVKLALIDACFRMYSGSAAEVEARRIFDLIKAQPVRVRPPAECVVQHTFLRVLQPARDSGGEEAAAGPFARTIAYRELVFFSGHMDIALGLRAAASPDFTALANAFAHVNYFGKRGSFWQFQESSPHLGVLPAGFSLIASELAQHSFDTVGRYRVTEYLDEFGPKLCAAKNGFERISTYHDGEIKLAEHRILQPTLLPYERRSGGRHFTYYHRTVPEAPNAA